VRLIVGAAVVLGVLILALLLSFLVAPGMVSLLRGAGVVKVYTYRFTDTTGLSGLLVNDTNGAISVGVWRGDYVYVNATLTRFLYPISVNTTVRRVGDTLDILVHEPHTILIGGYYTLSFNILVPESLNSLSVRVVDVNGGVRVQLESFSDLEVNSVNGVIQLALGSGGSVEANDINGDINLTSSNIRGWVLMTVNGEITASFTPTLGGVYRALTTNGDIRIMVPSNSSLSVTMATVNGALSVSGLRLANTSMSKTTLAATIGSGSATLTLTTTNGDIKLASH